MVVPAVRPAAESDIRGAVFATTNMRAAATASASGRCSERESASRHWSSMLSARFIGSA